MSISVLIVDDSAFFRKRVCEILNSVQGINVVGTASNGREAIEQVKKLNPDVVTMDYEMPVMDGITAVRTIMAECPTSILMFSSLTYEGARVTLDALEAGAVDFLPKNFEDIARDTGTMQEVLKKRILDISRDKVHLEAACINRPKKPAAAGFDENKPVTGDAFSKSTTSSKLTGNSTTAVPNVKNTTHRVAVSNKHLLKPKKACSIAHSVELLVIGASTGGPVALQNVLSKLPADFPVPVLIIQHMPSSFTSAFADRLNSLSQLTIQHASDGDLLKKGVALLAPGGKQMIVSAAGQNRCIKILEGDERLTYKPSVDVTFGSAAKAFPGRTLGLILTGMGADGREGCRMLKQSGSTIWTQDKASCVIYGMPGSVVNAGYSDASIALDHIANRILDGVM